MVEDKDIALTGDGVVDNVFNGIPDWVYEEEVLSTNYAHYIREDKHNFFWDFPSIGFLVPPPSLHFCTPLPSSSRSARPPSLL